ncbi:MAG: CapA family protein [Acidobacteria bacterium]|nr:CapA family protein [Acidobacteriota bacterium]
MRLAALLGPILLLASPAGARGADRPSSGHVSFAAVGDVLFDRAVRNTLETAGGDRLFDGVKRALAGVELGVCNLECPLCDPACGRALPKRIRFRGDPGMAAVLRRAGFTAAVVANNHAIDWGREGFAETLRHLEAAGLTPVGGGPDLETAFRPAWFRAGGLRVALFGCLAFLPEGFPPAVDRPGPAVLDLDRLEAEIRRARERADAVVVSFHWGPEGSAVPDSRQREWARRVVDAGADLVIGHHPHVLQPIEHYRGALILYSLGNFLFDNRRPDQRETVIFRCGLRRGGIEGPRLVPVVLGNDHRPRAARGETARRILRGVSVLSAEGGVRVDPVSGSVAVCDPQPGGVAGENPPGRPAQDTGTTVPTPPRSEGGRAPGPDRPTREFIDPASGADGPFRRPFRLWSFPAGRLEAYERFLAWVPSGGAPASEPGAGGVSWRPPGVAWRLRDACAVADADRIRVYAILEDGSTGAGGRLAVIPLDPGPGRFETPLLDAHEGFNPWKVRRADVDGDGEPEVLLGVFKPARYDPEPARRLFVYAREGNAVYPKWFGSRLALPLEDFEVDGKEPDGREALQVEERRGDGSLRTARYVWDGFGFRLSGAGDGR